MRRVPSGAVRDGDHQLRSSQGRSPPVKARLSVLKRIEEAASTSGFSPFAASSFKGEAALFLHGGNETKKRLLLPLCLLVSL